MAGECDDLIGQTVVMCPPLDVGVESTPCAGHPRWKSGGFPIRESGYNYQRRGERIWDGQRQQIGTGLHTKKKLIVVKYIKVRGNSVRRTLLNGSTKLVPLLSESTSR